ncbi:CheR family methyltransferase [Chitinophagaceae bacterium MMS25-I14]
MSVTITISDQDLEEILQVIKWHYGYDFNDYAHTSIKRRIIRCMQLSRIYQVYDFKYNLINDRDYFSWFLQAFTVNVTEMFRDPLFYKSLRENVIPRLASYPVLKIWHAGCATGEEVYSMAILLQEEGLLERTRIYATDINPANIEKARTGIIPLQQMKNYTASYMQSGGKADFSDYYAARYDHAIIDKQLRQNIVFSQHNLVTDQVFNEFQLICCRNVLIYFNRSLQDRVLGLFHESLAPLGYLALGSKESLSTSAVRPLFEPVDAQQKIFRRKM